MAIGRLSQLLFIFVSPLLIRAGKIDNRILNSPLIECGNGAITFNFETEKPFTGRVYVRGLEDNAACTKRFSLSAPDQSSQTKFSLSLTRGACNMDRQRTQDGVVHSITVIVAFHQVFETKNDVAFRGLCFFRTAANDADAAVEEGSVATEKAPAQPFSANCTYSIRGVLADGPVVRFAKVGDMLHHVWECKINDSKQKPQPVKDFGMLIHSCSVEDGRGAQYELLDQNGCPLDANIGLPLLEYGNDTDDTLRAVAAIWTYKFSKTTEVKYKCAVAICDRRLGQCDAAPPKCGQKQKGEESKAKGLKQLDVVTSIHALDNFDEQLGEGGVPASFFQQLNENSGKKSAKCLAARCRNPGIVF